MIYVIIQIIAYVLIISACIHSIICDRRRMKLTKEVLEKLLKQHGGE